MIINKILNYKPMNKLNIIYIFLFSLIFLGCSKDQDPINIDETVYIRYKGADMPVYMHGNLTSDVLLLVVHGGPGGNALEYRVGLWPVELEKKYLLAYWDQRGQGMSHGHYSSSDVTIAQMAEDMDAVINGLKAKYGKQFKVFALGHSWGGTLTSKYVTTDKYQHTLNGWIEFDGAHDWNRIAIEAVKMFIRVANEQIALGNSVDKWQGILTWASDIDTNNISYDQTLEINQKGFEVEDWLMEDNVMQEYESGGYPYALFDSPINLLTSWFTGSVTSNYLADEIMDYSATDLLYKVDIPVLFIWGKYDFVVPPPIGYDAYNKVSSTNKTFVLLEKSGHSGMMNEWEKTKDAIIEFIETNR